MVLDEDAEDQLDWSFEKWENVAYSHGGEEYRT